MLEGRYERKRRRQVLPSLFRGPGTNKELTFDPLSNANMYLDEGCTVSTQAGILKDAQKQLCSLSDEHFLRVSHIQIQQHFLWANCVQNTP